MSESVANGRWVIRRSAVKKELEHMFFGQFEHNIDAKGRLTIPANFREEAPSGLYLTEGFDSNLIAYPKDYFEKIANNISQLSITDPESRALRRLIFSNAAMLTYDTAGRILIPVFLRSTAQINETCMIVGIGDSFEIWSAELWSQEASLNHNPQKNSNRWAAINISSQGN
ncbi:MAG: division/cell wall cluster transcriptional repressor MraZ [Anaerolineaceae bacterium]